MTAPQTDIDEEQAVAEDTAAGDDSELAALAEQIGPVEMQLLEAGIDKCMAEQPTMRLLNVEDAQWLASEGGGRHLFSIDGHEGILDAALGRFIPNDPGPILELWRTRLAADHAADTFEIGGEPRAIDWSTVEIADEVESFLQVVATTVTDEDGTAFRLPLRVPLEGDIEADTGAAVRVSGTDTAAEEIAEATDGEPADTTGEAPDANEDPLVEATGEDADADDSYIDKDYLAQYYSNVEFPFDGREYIIDWSTWDRDQVTPDGLVGAQAKASTAAGGLYDIYVWFNPTEGPQIVRATELDAPEEDEDAEEEFDAAYMNQYYADAQFPFEGTYYVIDWDTWTPGERTDDGQVGSEVEAKTEEGGRYELYVWFGTESGVRVVRATELEAPAAEAEEEPADEEAADADDAAEDADADADADADGESEKDSADEEEPEKPAGKPAVESPQEEFNNVISQQLRDVWAGRDRRLVDVSGKEYDVSGWINGDYDCELRFTGHDGAFYYARLGATKVGDGEEPVTCLLRIQDPQTVWVESEESRS
jgi:hypothetical protein